MMLHPIRQLPHAVHRQVLKIHPVPQLQVEQDPQPKVVIGFAAEVLIFQRLNRGGVKYSRLYKARLGKKIP